MRKIQDYPMIELLFRRLSQSNRIDQIVLATSNHDNNKSLLSHVQNLGFSVYKGSEKDVLDRYYQAAKLYQADIVIRITGDCPLIDSKLVDDLIDEFIKKGVDYLSNTIVPTYPDGLDTEVFTFAALEKAALEANKPFDREHVTPYLKKSKDLQNYNILHSEDCSWARWTVDEPVDFEVITKVFAHFAPDIYFTWQQVLELQHSLPSLFSANQQIIRNEGATMGIGQKLWKRAKQVIPGGNMLLSKRAEMFLPEQLARLLQQGQRMQSVGPGWQRVHRHVHHGHWHQYPGIWSPGSRRCRTANCGCGQYVHL